jgi:phospholipid/cholesterol/gamma-HCH transport system ATP-binding protein
MTTPPAQQPAAGASADPLIRLHNIHKSFGSLVVLSGLNLEVRQRESLVVIGPSGTGKSVLLKHLVGLLKPDQGEVYFKGQRVDNLNEAEWDPVRRHFGFLFQMGALFDSLSVNDNIAFPLREHGTFTEAQVADIVGDKLAMVGLENTRYKMPGDLSGGQKKRVALARAIALDPEVVLYDEPTTGLDPIRSDVINELILKLQEELKVTSIVVTHDMASAFKVGNRLVMLLDGNIIAEGTPNDIRNSKDDRVQRFVQGRASPEDLLALRRATEEERRDSAGR